MGKKRVEAARKWKWEKEHCHQKQRKIGAEAIAHSFAPTSHSVTCSMQLALQVHSTVLARSLVRSPSARSLVMGR